MNKIKQEKAAEKQRLDYIKSLQKKKTEVLQPDSKVVCEDEEQTIEKEAKSESKPAEPAAERPPSSRSAKSQRPASSGPAKGSDQRLVPEKLKLDEIDTKLKQLEELEKRIKQSEENVILEAKKAEDRLQQQLQMIEEKAKQAEADRLAREELMRLAVGPLSHRSPFNTNGGKFDPRKSPFGTAFSTRTNGPPSARSAKAGALPSDAPKLTYQGNEWIQLWDNDEQAYYWWCEKLQKAQWEQPGLENYYPSTAAAEDHNSENFETHTESGYESAGGMTDYSTDHDTSYYTDSEFGDLGDWQEYWDEQAQAKYWYNNATVSTCCIVTLS